MSSKGYQKTWIDGGTKDRYVLATAVLDDLLGDLKRRILHDPANPLKERILDLYTFCIEQMARAVGDDLYGTSAWESIRTATRNFLLHLTDFDLDEWERREAV